MDRRHFISTLGATLAGTGIIHSSFGKEKKKTILPHRMLGKTGVEVSALILGGVAGMKQPPSDELIPAELANAALDAGINYFDTAPAYNKGQSEKNYGEVLAQRRNEVFLATKTGQRSYDGAMRDVEESLQRLRTDHVDLLQVHGARKDEDVEAWGKPDGVLKAFEKLRDQKVIRFIGVTGHESAETMRKAIELYEFDTILTTFNPTEKRRLYQTLVLPVAKKKNMGILAMKVMGGGLGSLARGNPLKNDGVWYHDEAAKQAGAGALIRYVLGLPISAAVVGMSSLEQLRVNIQAVKDAVPLGKKERRDLEAQMSS